PGHSSHKSFTRSLLSDISIRYIYCVLSLAILGLLKDQELHGYELKRRLTEVLGPFSSVSFGSLYPALGRLESVGALSIVKDAETTETRRDAPPVPMTGSIAGEAAAFRARRTSVRRSSSRTRKVYAITPKGEQLFEELLDSEMGGVDDDRAFTLKLAFCRFLTPERRLGLFELRRAHLVERLARSRSNARARADGMDSYTRSLIDHGTEATEHDISWLDRLIAIERQGGNK
ncbi:MAG: helix-turn-helix transcriptional regulator, partial [Pseudonocardiaceae bacterium]